MKPLTPMPLWQRLTRFLGTYEKILLALLSVVIVISGALWYRQFSSIDNNQPADGGTLTIGVVGDQAQIEQTAARLTETGLFNFDSQGNLQKQLVKNWSVNSASTIYTLTLLPHLDLNQIKDNLNSNSQALDQAITAVSHNQLVITLPSADPSFPLLLTQPLTDLGPFQVSKITDGSAILIRNTNLNATTAYINRILVDGFKTNNDLLSAMKAGKVDTALTPNDATKLAGFTLKTFSLPRYYAVFFNLNRAPFRDQTFGSSVVADQSIPNQTFVLTAPNTEPYKTLANQLLAKWQKAGASVSLNLVNETSIAEQVGPTRNFQALLSGMDYTNELDPYYLWDSSQIRPPGNNLSGLKDSNVDTSIAQIRQTTNIAQRQNLISALNKSLQADGAVLIGNQDTASYFVSNAVRSVNPWLPSMPDDFIQNIASWSVR